MPKHRAMKIKSPKYRVLEQDTRGYQYKTKGPNPLDTITTYYIRHVDGPMYFGRPQRKVEAGGWQVTSESCDWCNAFTRRSHDIFETLEEVERYLANQKD